MKIKPIVLSVILFLMFFGCKKTKIEYIADYYLKTYETGITEDLIDLSFSDKNNGLIIANPSLGYGIILKTIDGGKTWAKSLCPKFGQLTKIKFFKNNTAYLHCDTFLLKSTDGGANWSYIKKIDVYSTTDFITDMVGYCKTSGGSLTKTTDGGASWTSVYDNRIGHENISFNYTSYPNEKIIYASATKPSGEVLSIKSFDGGSTWETFTVFSVAYNGSMYFYAPAHGIITASNGNLIKTKDAGVTWYEVTKDQSINNINMIDENLGYSFKDYSLAITNDGAENWRSFLKFNERANYSNGDDTPIRAKNIVGFSDGTFYLCCKNGKFCIIDTYNLGE